MSPSVGQPLDALDSPQLLLDLDVVDANARAPAGAAARPADRRCASISSRSSAPAWPATSRAAADALPAAKLNEAEVLADAGITDVFVANQIVGPHQAAPPGRPGQPRAGPRLRR